MPSLRPLPLAYIVVWILLGSRLSLGSTCDELFQAGRLNSRVEGKKGQTFPLYTEVTKENISHIFTHIFDPDRPDVLGAKAVAVTFYDRAPTILFFPTGLGRTGYNVHHRDALKVALEMEMQRNKIDHEQRFEVFSSMIEGSPLSDLRELQRTLSETALLIDETAREIEQMTLPNDLPALIKIRGKGSDLDFQAKASVALRLSQGYQLQAKNVDGRWKIVGLQVDSSITSLQRRLPESPSVEYQQRLFKNTVNAIDPSLIGFPSLMDREGRRPSHPAPISAERSIAR